MGIGHYVFALFVAVLICVIAIVFKLLFANVRAQRKLLDEQESKLLQLYVSVETLMEDFNEQVKLTTAELKEHEHRASEYRDAATSMSVFQLPPELEKKEQVAVEKLPRTPPFEANRIRAAGEVLERAERIVNKSNVAVTAQPQTQSQPQQEGSGVFQKFFDDAVDTPVPESTTSASNNPSTHSRTDAILALAAEGKSDVEIAQELGITRNEVLLVVGLRG